MSIANVLAQRQITEALHFTTNKGLVGTLAQKSLLSRYRLPSAQYLEHVLHVNAQIRPEEASYFDKSQNWLDYVNLSISEINRRFFEFSIGWHQANDIWWAILSFDPVIMTHDGVVFTTTNNGYEHCVRGGDVNGLDALFTPQIARKGTWNAYRGNRVPSLATCEQAEVLYPGLVSTQFLRKIYVTDGEQHDNVCSWLREFESGSVEVVISPEKFTGKKN